MPIRSRIPAKKHTMLIHSQSHLLFLWSFTPLSHLWSSTAHFNSEGQVRSGCVPHCNKHVGLKHRGTSYGPTPSTHSSQCSFTIEQTAVTPGQASSPLLCDYIQADGSPSRHTLPLIFTNLLSSATSIYSSNTCHMQF